MFLLVGFGEVVSASYSLYTESNRGPYGESLQNANSIAFRDNIYIYDNSERIRVFDKSGTELKSWRVNTAHGAADLTFDSADRLVVRPVRRGMALTFDREGNLVDERKDPISDFRSLQRRTEPIVDGSVFLLENDAVYRIRPNGKRETVIPAGAPRPLPAPILLAHGVFVYIVGCGLRLAQQSQRNAA